MTVTRSARGTERRAGFWLEKMKERELILKKMLK